VPTKVNNLNSLFNPIMKLVECGPFSYIINFAFNLFQNFLDNGLFLKIINLLVYLLSVNVQHGLTV